MESNNPIERELVNAIGQSSVQGDVELNEHMGNQYTSFAYENNLLGKMILDKPLRPFQMNSILDNHKKWIQ